MARAALEAAVSREALREHEPALLDGHKLALSFVPSNAEELAEGLRALESERLAAIVCGGRSQIGLGNLASRADVWLATERLAGIEDLDADEGVARVRAGTLVAALADAAREAGWELPLDPVGENATVGGTLAAAALGPRAQGFGRPRDTVLGLDVVHASGTRTRCGGRVVKNVTGYDLAKLYVGSFGTLGVLESAWLRLRPRPEAVECQVLDVEPGENGVGSACTAARLASARVAALLDAGAAQAVAGMEPANGRLLVVELAGDAVTVERDRSRLDGASPAPADALERLRAWQGGAPEPEELRYRLALPVSRIAACLAALAPRASCVAHPGLGVVYARFPLPQQADERACDEAERAVRGVAREHAGSCVLEHAPAYAKEGPDVFGPTPETLPLMRALKQQFDPSGVLNPGRFVGRI